VVIGGTACGPKAAARARRCDPSARITIIEQRGQSFHRHLRPALFRQRCHPEEKRSGRPPDQLLPQRYGHGVFTGTCAIAVHPQEHTVTIQKQKVGRRSIIEYDKLVIATGAAPILPDWPGKDLAGIFTLSGIPDVTAIKDYLSKLRKKEVVIIGAGLIGLEMAEAFRARGLKVTVIEALDRPLPSLLDADIAAHVAKHLQARGITISCGERATGFTGDKQGRVRQVVLGDAELEAGLVLLSLGVRPNAGLARDAGLSIGATGGIAVDEYLQTSDPDIYAGGDCVEVVNIMTGKKALVPLGSTANKHGRIIGTNVTGGRETFPGVLGTAIAKVFDFNVARVGLNETQAREAGFEVVTSLVPASEHAGYYPGARDIIVKLVAEKTTGQLLGGQIIGPGETAKRCDVLATALTFGATVHDLANLDLAYAPPYNSALDPLHHAANVIRNKLAGRARALPPAAVREKLADDEDLVLLDVRSPAEWRAGHIEAKTGRLIPLPELRRRLDELPRDKEIITCCRSSIRAYQAQRMLDGADFKDVKFLDGSLAAWPYETRSERKK
jgi:NADPH-dependent 2,4-dienoyl-CoA reductase/sulfur reductase-like enzyme/rhodanese-related sulfurtransferase